MEQKTTEATGPQQPRPSCEIPDCESPARYRGTCSPEHHQERALRRQAALRGISLDERSSWHDEDGRVDIDAVRAGTPDLADAPAIYESLCDEVEQLRAAHDLLRETARALTVPLPARTVEAESEYLWVLARRASVVRESVDAALDPADAADFSMAARNVRSQAPLQIAMYQIREDGDVR